jgi:nucleoside-diphosphate-sugar epimerase
MDDNPYIVITGGAGYIGSLLTAELLRAGCRVTVIDNLCFGGESLLGFIAHPNFHFAKADVTEAGMVCKNLRSDWPKPQAVIHLAAIVGFPACKAIGDQASWKINFESVQRVYEQADQLGCDRLIFSSTYSNYGLSADGKPVNEESPLNPQSLYAETKIAAEQWLGEQKTNHCAPLIFRFATLFGISPRTRFDLIINQFTLEAFTKHELLIYQRGFSRSFVHVRDVVRGLQIGLQAPREKICGQIYNLGSDLGNYTKEEIVSLVVKHLPDTVVRYKDLSFGGDMRDITVSFEKVKRELGYDTQHTVEDGVQELIRALSLGLIRDPNDQRYRNAEFIVQ